MIVLYLSGGLGNQLFSYAAARSLSYNHHTDIIIDASLYANQWGEEATRPIILDMFPVKARFRHMGPLLDNPGLYARIRRRLSEDFFVISTCRVSGNYNFYPEFLKLGARVIMKGYYISPLFFSKVEDVIRRELTLPEDFLQTINDETGMRILDTITSAKCPVSLHVRRGDFLNYSNPRLYLPNIENYYVYAMKYISERTENSSYWIFSDDPIWCKNYFKNIPYDIHIVETNGKARKRDIREFYLMSQCNHQIICNSTFSWWAAWLNRHTDKIVIAPDRWDLENRTPINEMIPPEWTRLNV